MDKVMGEIYVTKDYDKFGKVLGNRKLNKLNIKNLTAVINKTEDIRPIEVNEKYEVIDGQHRLEVAKTKKIAVPYYIIRKADLGTVQTLNSNSKIWNKDDFMESWIEKGKKDYKIYKDFKNSYKFPHEVCMTLLTGYDGGDSLTQFKNGDFKIRDIEKAAHLGGQLTLIGKYYKNYTRRGFVGAMMKCFKNKQFNVDVFLKKLSLQPNRLVDCAKTDQYLLLIEDIYNYHSREKVNLRY